MPVRYLDLVDYLLIAEATLGIRAAVIQETAQLELADSALSAPAASFAGHEFYPDIAMKAAVLCVHLIRNHPLLDGNKRVGFMCTVEFIERNGFRWNAPPGDGHEGWETVRVIEAVAAGELSEADLAPWIADRMNPIDPV